MIGRERPAGTRARDLGLEQRDARVELVHRQGIEILPRQFGERVLGLGGEQIVRVHAMQR